ncbi:enhancer of mRNA-decapping protein 4 [Mytilus galloprovincialis]|uniref:Enhancer of mRNA-decapping protein 4 n=1 Tax=Mytilus galloprovincialis TaxID=29158 RepID=A0A8B6DVG0_MYTGA|nr:enhancer of mRNA-decapping protein 4 [Mytilus galloprovincialis]
MDDKGSPSSSLNSASTGDTGHLLHELMNLQKSNAMSSASISSTLNMRESADVPGPGEATAPTINELMQTFYSQSQPSHRQLITLQGSDTVNSFSVYGQEVDVVASKPISTGILSQPTTGSNKVKITPVVKYDWEALFYVGNLVAIHRNNTYAAYTLRGKSGGVVRIINRKTAERALLKDFAGRVIDIAFAHTDDILIGAVDEIGNLMVYHVKETDDRKLIVLLSLHIRRPDGEQPSEFHRVIWCPFIPDDCDDSSMTESSTQDASRVLVLTHNEKAEIWNIELVTKEHGNGPLDAEDVDFGLIKITSHTQPVMDAAFSPDGTALATASLDGEVKFFQVNMNESTSPRCLHQWKPHDGKKLSSLFFLDDHKNSSPDAQFWKFAVTGADNNQEIKIWSCESWTCLQTLTFVCPPGLPSNFQIDPCMKAALDLGAKYLILTDIKRKVLYVLQIFQDNTNNTAHFSSISEFILAQPCLSFAILDASKKKFKKTGEDSNLDDMTTGELIKDDHDDNEQKPDVTSSGVQIRLYTVHPKALQELQIRFQPESSAPPPPTPSISTVSHDDTGIQDALSDLSMDTNNHNNSQDLSHPLLLTPDAFTSSPRKAQADTTVEQTRTSMGSSTSSFTHVTGLQEELYSPRSSQGNQSVISEGSTITQTPNSKEYSPHIVNGETTPGSVPLPPVSSTEENELETPKSKAQSGENTPISLERLNNVCMDDFFDTQGSRQTNERTLDTASTTGFEVVEGSQKPKSPKESFDENDEEVAGVLGETYDEEESKDVEGTQPFVEQSSEKSDMDSTQGSDKVIRAWPLPPDVSSEQGEEEEENEQCNYQDQDEGDEDVQVEEEEVVCEEEEEDDTSREKEEPVPEVSSEEIEEHILEEQSEESEQEGPKEAPVAEKVKPQIIIKEVPVRIQEVREIVRETVDRKALSQLQDNIQNILNALESQNGVIERLQEQLADQQEKQNELQRQQIEIEQLRHMSQQPQPNIEEHLGQIRALLSRVERMFTQHAQKENQRINHIMQQSETREKQRHERLQHTLVQTLQKSVANNVEDQVRDEMRNTVLPAVTRSLEPVKEQLHQELAQKLTATDSLLKDNIGKMIRSKQTTEAIGLAAGNALQTPIQAAYREAFQNIVIPNFDRATQNMFQQVNEAFTKGTKEYIRTLETHLDVIKQKHTEARDPIVAQMRKLADSFQTSAESMKAQVTASIQSQVQSEMQNSFLSLQETLIRAVRQAVKDEVNTAVQEQGATISSNVLDAMRSGAATPIPTSPDPQQARTHIMQLLRQGQLNAAFQQALSAANLELVVFVCETVNPAQIFNQTPCPLEQPVLLSLIQQLSADIGQNTELKHKYLEEAVMNLDLTNKITQEHMRGVLYSLIQKLKNYISQHPNDKTCRHLKMLQMASESLLK